MACADAFKERAALLDVLPIEALPPFPTKLWYVGTTMLAGEQIDWSQCPLVEVKAHVQSGAPVLRGTRLPVAAIVDNAAYGMTIQEISEQFQVSEDQVEAILAYAKSHRFAHPV